MPKTSLTEQLKTAESKNKALSKHCHALEDELASMKKKLKRKCDHVANAKAQLQAATEGHKDALDELEIRNKALAERNETLLATRSDLERKLRNAQMQREASEEDAKSSEYTMKAMDRRLGEIRTILQHCMGMLGANPYGVPKTIAGMKAMSPRQWAEENVPAENLEEFMFMYSLWTICEEQQNLNSGPIAIQGIRDYLSK